LIKYNVKCIIKCIAIIGCMNIN